MVDWASKQLISIPTTDKVTAHKITKLFLHHVFTKHGILLHVTCDRGSKFTSQFFRSLGKLLDITLHFTSGYNLQADGQSERVNQTLKQYLCHYCSYQQDNWSELLPLVEFMYNNAPNASTGVSPFFVNKGYHPALDIHLEHNVALLQAREFATNLQELHLYLAESLKLAQECYQAASDPHWTPPPPFNPGNEVFILSKFICTTCPSHTLSECYLGPFKILDHISWNSVQVSLPNDLCRIHPVFHVSQLEPHVPNQFEDRALPPPEPIEVNSDVEYELRKISDLKYDYRYWKSCELFYLVCWTGYKGTNKEYSWLSALDLTHANEATDDFHQCYPNKPSPDFFGPEHHATVSQHMKARKHHKEA